MTRSSLIGDGLRRRPLPRSLTPLPDESLAGFLLRLSCRLHVPPGQIASMTGLRKEGDPSRNMPSHWLFHLQQPVL